MTYDNNALVRDLVSHFEHLRPPLSSGSARQFVEVFSTVLALQLLPSPTFTKDRGLKVNIYPICSFTRPFVARGTGNIPSSGASDQGLCSSHSCIFTPNEQFLQGHQLAFIQPWYNVGVGVLQKEFCYAEVSRQLNPHRSCDAVQLMVRKIFHLIATQSTQLQQRASLTLDGIGSFTVENGKAWFDFNSNAKTLWNPALFATPTPTIEPAKEEQHGNAEHSQKPTEGVPQLSLSLLQRPPSAPGRPMSAAGSGISVARSYRLSSSQQRFQEAKARRDLVEKEMADLESSIRDRLHLPPRPMSSASQRSLASGSSVPRCASALSALGSDYGGKNSAHRARLPNHGAVERVMAAAFERELEAAERARQEEERILHRMELDRQVSTLVDAAQYRSRRKIAESTLSVQSEQAQEKKAKERQTKVPEKITLTFPFSDQRAHRERSRRLAAEQAEANRAASSLNAVNRINDSRKQREAETELLRRDREALLDNFILRTEHKAADRALLQSAWNTQLQLLRK